MIPMPSRASRRYNLRTLSLHTQTQKNVCVITIKKYQYKRHWLHTLNRVLRCCRSQEFSVEEKGVTRAASYGFVKEVEAGKEFCDISLPDFNGLVDNAHSRLLLRSRAWASLDLCSFRYNALHWATRNGRIKVMDLLIKSVSTMYSSLFICTGETIVGELRSIDLCYQ